MTLVIVEVEPTYYQQVNGTPSSPPVEISRGSIARTVERSKASATGTSAAQSSRRAKNAAHRANDIGMHFAMLKLGARTRHSHLRLF